MTLQHDKLVEEKVQQLQKSTDIDDTLEHSRYGIGQDTEYGWDKLRAEASKRDKENFANWLNGITTIVEADIEENPEHSELKQWKKYLKTLKEIRHKLNLGKS